jgi:hypothetical protein
VRCIISLFIAILLSLASGCALIQGPPPPPDCKGEYRPVNPTEQKGASFDATGKVVRCEGRGLYGRAG